MLLARRGADASQHRRERDGAHEDARRLDEVALGVRLQEARDVDVAGALVLAGRQAVGVVVAEDELQVRLADLAQARRLRPHDHVRLRRARAGDRRRLLAVDLDDAHPAGAEARAAWARSRASGTSMPLSRQTSRMVWPSRPESVRPSISIVNDGAAWRRCGPASSAGARRLVRRRLATWGSVSVIVSGGLGLGRARGASAAITVPLASHRRRWAGTRQLGTTLHDVVLELRREVSHPREERVRRPRPPGRTEPRHARPQRGRRPGRHRRVGRGRCRSRPPSSESRRVPMRQGMVLPQASSLT